jgi:YVTN family beta-propeller protein
MSTPIATAPNMVIAPPIAVGNNPLGVAVNPDGSKVYVANSTDGTVSVIATATNMVLGSPITVGSGPVAFGLFIQPATVVLQCLYGQADGLVVSAEVHAAFELHLGKHQQRDQPRVRGGDAQDRHLHGLLHADRAGHLLVLRVDQRLDHQRIDRPHRRQIVHLPGNRQRQPVKDEKPLDDDTHHRQRHRHDDGAVLRATPERSMTAKSMMPNSGHRFSEKIMLQQKDRPG